MLKRSHPGKFFLEMVMKPQNMSIDKAAQVLNSNRNHISDFIDGKKPITKNLAQSIAGITNNSPEFWIRKQKAYDQQQ